MRIFSALYQRAMQWSRHRHAPRYLGGISFAESSFFPIPPDVMLAPMSLANPSRAWRFALITTLASVAGGLFGYRLVTTPST
jgi:membrane protein YqaA with SNARE-associated domain